MSRSTSQSSGRLGLFGGTFDPPHWGHFLAAREAWEKLGLDRVIFLPCRQSPHKTNRRSTAASTRYDLVKALVRGESWAEVSRVDLDRRGPSYSYLTAEDFRRSHPGSELYWIMGSDQWEVLPSWSHPERLAELVQFAVFPRPREPRPRRGMRLHVLPTRYDVSASQIRSRLKQGKSIKGLVPGSVARIIQTRQLYTA